MHCGVRGCNLAWPPEPAAQGVSPCVFCMRLYVLEHGCCCGAPGSSGIDPKWLWGPSHSLLGCTGHWTSPWTSCRTPIMAAALCWWVGLDPEFAEGGVSPWVAGGLHLPTVYAGGPINWAAVTCNQGPEVGRTLQWGTSTHTKRLRENFKMI